MDTNTKRLSRLWVGAETNTPVEFISGDDPPKIDGESYYWTTPSGKTRVRHPNAYGYRTVYHHSTRVVVVGEGWRPPQTVRTVDDGVVGEWIVSSARGLLDCSTVRGWCRRARTTLVRRADGRTFHFGGWSRPSDAVDAARAAWARQDQTERAEQARRFAGWCPRALPLTWAASVAAGNCEAGALAWARRARAVSGRISLARALARRDLPGFVRRTGEAAACLLDACPMI